MKRLFGHLFTFVSALSLLLCVAVILGWVASSHFSWQTRLGRLVLLWVDHGALTFATYARQSKVGDRFGVTQTSSVGPLRIKRTPGVSPPNSRVEYSVRLAHMIPLCGVLPVVWIVMWRRARTQQTPPGLCLACGYDLRATPDRCPECGTDAPLPSSTVPS
jgi:hypothetical protein